MTVLTRLRSDDAPTAGAADAYAAFLSYSHADEKTATWVHRRLEQFKVPPELIGKDRGEGLIPRRLRPVFRDRQELAAARDLGSEVDDALAGSRVLIVLCSPAAAASRWVNSEIERFHRVRPAGQVIAAIVTGEPYAADLPGREAEECFPPALKVQYDELGRATTRRAEPIAADLRDGKDGQRIGFLKIVAGMLGVGLDELVKRDAARRQRRMAIITSASIVGMALTSGLALFAFEKRDEARDQRREAEGLVGFMLGDLRDKLEPIGRLDALDAVGSRAFSYFQTQDKGELSDKALAQRSAALSLMGEIADTRGNLDGALARYREAMAGTAEMISRDPDDPQRLFDHAQNMFWIGDIARRRGQMDTAEAGFRDYELLADRMVQLAPGNPKWRMEVQYARENLGIVLMSQRRFGDAYEQFSAGTSAMTALAARHPGNRAYRTELANLLGWLADAEKSLGQLDQAIATRTRQVAYLEQPIGDGSPDVTLRQQLIPAHQSLGVLFTARGDLAKGADQYRLALGEAGQLLAVEAGNSIWREFAASVRLALASNLLALGQQSEAAHNVAAGCGLTATLRSRDAKVTRWSKLQTSCITMQSRVALADGEVAQAAILASRALTAARSERSDDLVADRYRVAAADRWLGDIRRRGGDEAGARVAWSDGIAQLLPTKVETPWEMNERAELLRRLGRRNDVRPIAARLSAIGYRDLK